MKRGVRKGRAFSPDLFKEKILREREYLRECENPTKIRTQNLLLQENISNI